MNNLVLYLGPRTNSTTMIRNRVRALMRFGFMDLLIALGYSALLVKAYESKFFSEMTSGAEVQTLYNLLQSSRICRSIAGPHANLPPTLIAAQPFLYAQMQALKVCSCNLIGDFVSFEVLNVLSLKLYRYSQWSETLCNTHEIDPGAPGSPSPPSLRVRQIGTRLVQEVSSISSIHR
ncbi:unnamed protein product [Angiostrongylus costaricensis]|uniref:Uncharacterized protein n=1 Tax=Angiostrongylus costaricensis TaxID=334426 RepID=A0A0R3PIT6_ANGCS|nr:unnamed protein product [Angiostrongylus costaricensis]